MKIIQVSFDFIQGSFVGYIRLCLGCIRLFFGSYTALFGLYTVVLRDTYLVPVEERVAARRTQRLVRVDQGLATCRVSGLGFRVSGLGFRVWGCGEGMKGTGGQRKAG